MKSLIILAAFAAAGVSTPSLATPPQSHAEPRDLFSDSCRDISVRDGRLSARCRSRRGDWRMSTIHLDSCRGGAIANIDGRLTCRPGPDRQWRWPWGAQVTVYRDADFRGASATFRGRVPDLRHTGFNDAISSMRFRGAWEACADAHFRGACRTFTGSVRNLEGSGMNDRISSLRPAGDRVRY